MADRNDGILHLVARRGAYIDAAANEFPRPLAGTVSEIAMRRGDVLHIADAQSDQSVPLYIHEAARRVGNFSVANAPMMWEGRGIGTIDIVRSPPRPFSAKELALLKTFADQAVIAIQNAKLFNETQRALSHQTATADILKVISESPTNARPVFNAIVETAVKLLGCDRTALVRVEGAHYLPIAHATPAGLENDRWTEPVPIDPTANFPSQAIVRKQTVHIADWDAIELPERQRMVRAATGARSSLAVPLLREGEAIGALMLFRNHAGGFAEEEIALAESFRDQAVIAIENARLWNETKEALDQQRASGEVLAAISSSIADTAPVFDKILTSCEQLFAGKLIGINLVDDDGLIRIGAYHGPGREKLEAIYVGKRVDESTGTGSAILRRQMLHFPDVDRGEHVPVVMRDACRAIGIKSVIFAPMLWEGRGIGAIFVGREHAGALSDKEIALLRTFADQAVIAIQNARMFNDTKEALERQTATAEILRVISSSPTDVRPVFQAIVQTAVRLLSCDSAGLLRCDGKTYTPVVGVLKDGSPMKMVQSAEPVDPDANFPSRVIASKTILHLPDWSVIDLPKEQQRVYDKLGVRSSLYLPLLRDDECIGVLALGRVKPGAFTEAEIALAKSFVDQALIAVENVRLFNETKEALEQQTATAEVLQVISSSVADTAPVFDKILDSCQHLFATEQLGIFIVGADEIVHVGAWRGSALEAVAASFPKPLDETMTASVIRERRTMHIPDVLDAPGTLPIVRGVARADRQLLDRVGTDAFGGSRHRLDRRDAPAAAAFHGQGTYAASNLRGPGGDRDPEFADVQGDQ